MIELFTGAPHATKGKGGQSYMVGHLQGQFRPL